MKLPLPVSASARARSGGIGWFRAAQKPRKVQAAPPLLDVQGVGARVSTLTRCRAAPEKLAPDSRALDGSKSPLAPDPAGVEAQSAPGCLSLCSRSSVVLAPYAQPVARHVACPGDVLGRGAQRRIGQQGGHQRPTGRVVGWLVEAAAEVVGLVFQSTRLNQSPESKLLRSRIWIADVHQRGGRRRPGLGRSVQNLASAHGPVVRCW